MLHPFFDDSGAKPAFLLKATHFRAAKVSVMLTWPRSAAPPLQEDIMPKVRKFCLSSLATAAILAASAAGTECSVHRERVRQTRPTRPYCAMRHRLLLLALSQLSDQADELRGKVRTGSSNVDLELAGGCPPASDYWVPHAVSSCAAGCNDVGRTV